MGCGIITAAADDDDDDILCLLLGNIFPLLYSYLPFINFYCCYLPCALGAQWLTAYFVCQFFKKEMCRKRIAEIAESSISTI